MDVSSRVYKFVYGIHVSKSEPRKLQLKDLSIFWEYRGSI